MAEQNKEENISLPDQQKPSIKSPSVGNIYERPVRKRSNSGSAVYDTKENDSTGSSSDLSLPILLRKRSVNDIIKERGGRDRKASEPMIFPESPTTPRKRRSKSKFTSLFRRSSNAVTSTPEVDRVVEQLAENYDTSKVVLLQSVIRSWRAQKHFLVSHKHPFSSRRATFQALKALSDNENRYVRILAAISQSYATPLRSKLTLTSVPKDSLIVLFFNTDKLLKYHTEAAARFHNILESWPISYIGMFLVSHLNQISILYNDYLTNLRRAEEVLEQQFKNTLGKLFLRNKAREHVDTGIESLHKLLSYPTTYLVGYKSFCLDLLYALAAFHKLPVYKDVSNATSMACVIKSSLERSIYKQDMKILCDRLSLGLVNKNNSAEPIPDFVTGHPSRKFIKEATITLRERKKLRLFLFSDVLLITKPKGKKFQLLDQVPLSEISHSPLERVPAYSIICYRIITPNKTYPLVERNTIGFAPVFIESVYIAKARAVVEHDRISNEPSLSPLILKILYYLDKSRMKEGLFRPSKKNFNNGLRLLSDELKGGAGDFNKFHRDELGGALVVYLMMLPQDYQVAGNLFCEGLDIGANKLPADTKVKRRISSILQCLPPVTRNWFDYLSFFLERTFKNTPLLTSEELSIHFASFLVMPNTSLIECCRQAPLIVRAFQFLIEDRSDIYKRVQSEFEEQMLPKNALEFIEDVDYFSYWWCSFRSQEPKFIEHVTSIEFFKSYFQILQATENIEQNNPFLVKNILMSEAIISRMLSNDNSKKLFFDMVVKIKENENALFHVMEVFGKLVTFDASCVTEYLLNIDPKTNESLILLASSGNVALACSRIISFAADEIRIHPLIIKWSKILMNKLVEFADEPKGKENWFENATELLGCVFQEKKFLIGPFGSKLCVLVDKYAAKLVHHFLHFPGGVGVSTAIFTAIHAAIEMPLEQEGEQLIPQDLDIKNSFDANISLAETSEDQSEELLLESHIVALPDQSHTEDPLSDDLSFNSYEYSGFEAGEASKIKTKFIHLLLDESQFLATALRGKDENGLYPPQLGFFRFSLLRIVSSIILLNWPQLDQRIQFSEWIEASIDLLIHYEAHSILHQPVRRMLYTIGNRTDSNLFETILQSSSLLARITDLLKQKKKPLHYRHLVLIIQFVSQLPKGKEFLDSSPKPKFLHKIAKG